MENETKKENEVVIAEQPNGVVINQDQVIRDIMSRVEDNSDKVEKIVDELVHKHCYLLDELIHKFTQCLQDKENPVTEEELDDVCLQLPSYLYFIGEAQEKFGIKEDVAKSIKMELYNRIHANTRGTIADKQAASEAGTIEEDIVYRAYQRTYKRIKQKLEAAYELLASVKKVVSRRMGEQDLANIDSGKFRRG